MIPIRDTIESKNYPVVNSLIIGINVFLYFVSLAQGEAFNRFILLYGLVPARYSVPHIADYFTFSQQVISFFSFMFLHGGFWHLLGNMWSLYIFGDNVEDSLGSLRYLLFYILCGVASGLFHLIINWQSTIPTIGASGAIAGVMGAYILLYPRSKILTLIPIFFIPYFVELSAFFFLGLWLVLQFINAAGSGAEGGGIAWWAHIGGFLFGIIFLKLFQMVPQLGVSHQVRRKTIRTKTPRLQAIHTVATGNDPHLYGSMTITPKEASSGTKKLVNMPWAFQKRLFSIKVPAGVRQGTTLRLVGMGRQMNGGRGDLYLRVLIRED